MSAFSDPAALVFLNGPRTGDRIPLTAARTVIGRSTGDLLLVEDDGVSSIHCIITAEGGRHWIMDLGSTNGVYVNDRQLLEAALSGGEELRLGDTLLRFELGAGPLVEGAPDLDALLRPSDPGLDTLLRAMPVQDLELPSSLDPIDEPVPTRDLDLLEAPPVDVQLDVLDAVGGVTASHVFRRNAVLVGREIGDIVLPDPDISRRHCVFEVFGARDVYVRDLGSTNGTFVNGRRITACRVHPGDVLAIGGVHLRYAG